MNKNRLIIFFLFPFFALNAQFCKEINALFLEDFLSLNLLYASDNIKAATMKIELEDKLYMNYTRVDYQESYKREGNEILIKNNFEQRKIIFFKDSIEVKRYRVIDSKLNVAEEYFSHQVYLKTKKKYQYKIFDYVTNKNTILSVSCSKKKKERTLTILNDGQIFCEYYFFYDSEGNNYSLIQKKGSSCRVLYSKYESEYTMYVFGNVVQLYLEGDMMERKSEEIYLINHPNNRNIEIGKIYYKYN